MHLRVSNDQRTQAAAIGETLIEEGTWIRFCADGNVGSSVRLGNLRV